MQKALNSNDKKILVVKHIITLLILSFFVIIGGFDAKANHLVGGEMSYTCLGGNVYEVSLIIHRDCSPDNPPNTADFDDPATIFVLDAMGNEVQSITLAHNEDGDTPIPPNSDGICGGIDASLCVEYFEYTATITLAPMEGGYDLVYQRCCRNGGITNMNLPNETGSTYILNIPHIDATCDNSAPVFNNLPPLVLCQGTPFDFDYSATDVDGDLLVYELCDPLEGASVVAPLVVNFADLTPFDQIEWAPGYDTFNQLGMTSNITIDSSTGLLTMQPEELGKFVVGICISEFRDGELLSQKVRDYQFTVVPCDVALADAGPDVELCAPAPITIEGMAFGENLTYQWDPAAPLDDATILTPTVAEPMDGMTFTLTVDNGAGCMDSDTMTISITSSSDSNPGTMSAGPVIACSGGAVSASSTGSSIASGDALAYYLHTNSGATAGDILDSNLTGTFSQVAGVISNNTYYISAVVGPDDGDGFPDLTSECIVIAPGTPVVFLNPLEIGVNEFCDTDEGLFSITIFAEGGYPEYDPSGVYTISDVADITLGVGESAEIALGEFDQQTYSIDAVDQIGCSNNFSNGPISCVKGLAITLGDFSAKRLNTEAQLEWNTQSETENDLFRVERSRDGSNFEVIALIDGAGTTSVQQDYSYRDMDLGAEAAFYRIASVDYNGQKEYTSVQFLSALGEYDEIVTFGPNPVSDFIVISTELDYSVRWNYRFYDASGKIVLSGTFSGSETVLMEGLSSGIYLLEVENGLNSVKSRIFKN